MAKTLVRMLEFVSDYYSEPAQIPEKALCVAILERVILDLTSPNIPRECRRSAETYLFGWRPTKPKKDLNLGMICEVLELDITTLQKTVREFMDSGQTFSTTTHSAKGRYAA